MADTKLTLHVDPVFAGLYVRQRDFQAQLEGVFPADLSDVAKMAYLRTQALALTDELHEALAETGWKDWTTSNHINRDAYKGELGDVFVFLMNMMLVADITPAELMEYVHKKITRNIERQAEGYDGVSTKCPHCKRAFDDEAVECTDFHIGDSPVVAWCHKAKEYVDKTGAVVVLTNHYAS